MNIQRLLRAALCGVLLVTGSATTYAQTAIGASAPAKATVNQLNWVTGAWTGSLGDRTIEQHWSAPVAGSIIAMYRSIRADKPVLYELLAIENEGEGVVLRIKHFTPGAGLVSQEAKDESMNHPLVSLDGRTAVFEGGVAANPVRVTFRSPDPGTLNITVDRNRDGKLVSTEFKYTRIKS